MYWEVPDVPAAVEHASLQPQMLMCLLGPK